MPNPLLEMKLGPGVTVPADRRPVTVEISFERAENAEASRRDVGPAVRDFIRVDLDGNFPVSIGLPGAILSSGVQVSFLTIDGTAAIERRIPGQDKGSFSLVLSSSDVATIFASGQRLPAAAPAPLITRRVKFVQTTLVTPDYRASSIAYAVVPSEAAWTDLSLESLFHDPKPVSSSIEWLGARWDGIARVNWQSGELAVDGSFEAQVPPTPDYTFLWWLQGPHSALGSVAPDLVRSSVNDKAIPAILPAFSKPAASPASGSGSEKPYTASGECGCADRVPVGATEEELANNPHIYTEDPGTFCKPFSNPERVLSERSFYTIIRADQPEVSAKASGSMNHQFIADFDNLLLLHGTKKDKTAPLGMAKQLKIEKASPAYQRYINSLAAGRTALDSNHPIQWEADIARYQASSVARGHILEYRVRWRSNGYSLGTVAKTLTLAPRQVKRIQKIEWERNESMRRAESTQQKDLVEDAVIRERDYDDALRASLHEWSFGASAAAAGGVAGGIGFFAEAVLGGIGAAAGGAGSAAYQEGGRTTTAREEQRLRDSIRRYGDALRRFESVVVNELTQEETVTGTTEVLRNFNYAHSLTVIYYQILRHLRVETGFAGVAECLFVPFAIKQFTIERAYRWREALGRHLRTPRYRRGMQYLRDVLTDFEYSDIPEGRRADQPITSLRGSIYLKLAVERPADTDDGYFNKSTWNAVAPLLPEPAHAIFAAISNVADADRDRFYQRNFSGGIASRWCDELRLTAPDGEAADADFTLASRYSFGGSVRVDFTVNMAAYPGLTRAGLTSLVIRAGSGLPPGSYANVTRVALTYTTDNFEYQIRDSGGTRDLIRPDTGGVDPGGALLSLPLTRWERVDQRAEIRQAVSELVEHLNEHVEYYHKAVWWSMDRDRLYMLIDGFYVPGTNNVSIASVVEREPLGIIGNSIVFKVSPGAFIGLGEIDTPAKLHNLYADNQKPRDPLYIGLPTDGLYAQSIMDPCPALEEHFGNTDWALGQPDIDPGTLAPELLTSRRAEPGDVAKPTPMPATIINLQNAPDAPAPAGLQGILDAVGKADSFRDLTGLAGNQANALAALQAASGLATSFGNQAASLAAAQLAARAHATNTADQKLASIKRAQDKGLIEQPEAARQAADVLRDMHGPEIMPRPHQEGPIIEAIHAAAKNSGSVIEANTVDGQVRIALGNGGADGTGPGTRDLDIVRDEPWVFEGEMLLANFDVAKSDLKSEHEKALLDLAEYVAERTAESGVFRIRSITGHASTTGPETPSGTGFAGNLQLSKNRAQNVLDHLQGLGVLREGELPSTVTAEGSLNPPVPTLMGVEHPMNRSVSIRFVIFDTAKAMAFEAGFRHWIVNLDVSVANLAGSLKEIAKHPTRPVSAGLKVGGKLDLGSLKNLDNGQQRQISIVSAYFGIGLGATIPEEMLPIPSELSGPLREKIVARMGSAISTLLGLTAASVSLPQIAEGEFFTYKPVDFEWFNDRPVIMIQCNATAFAGYEHTILAFIDPDAPKGIGAMTFMAGFVFAPLTYEASGTLHGGFLRLRDTI